MPKVCRKCATLLTFECNLSGGQTVNIPASVPWFEAWRETFLQVQFPSDHEFTKHYIACILYHIFYLNTVNYFCSILLYTSAVLCDD
jgi:hypothetical protein